MSLKECLIDCSKGDALGFFWLMYCLRCKSKGILKSLCTFLMCRSANAHGGYVGPGAEFASRPSLPHGLHGVFISRYAKIGYDCRIYQNVTIGEVDGQAPRIGDGVLIGAGAIIVGGINIGSYSRIGAGAVISRDIPAGTTAVASGTRLIIVADKEGTQV